MRWDDAARVLCVRLDTIGDVLMTGPAMRALRDGGRREVVLLTSSIGAEAGRLMPGLDDVIAYDPPWMKATAPRSGAGTDEAMLLRLRSGSFDGAVVFTAYSQSPLPAALMCHLAGIPLRLAHCRENPYQLLTDWVREPEPDRLRRHEVRRQLDLVATIGASVADERLSVAPGSGSEERVSAMLARRGVTPGAPWALFHPGASASSRRYAPEMFAEAAGAVARGLPVVFTGAAHEKALVDEIRTAMPVGSVSLAGRLTLAELTAAIGMAAVVVTNNTGPAHLAAATGTPVVDLYALTNPQHAPWMVPHRLLYHDVPCRNCYSSVCREGHHLCLRGVPPFAVATAVLEVLRGVERDLDDTGPVVPAPGGLATTG